MQSWLIKMCYAILKLLYYIIIKYKDRVDEKTLCVWSFYIMEN